MNKIIMGFECIETADKQSIQKKGLVIALEGGISNKAEGTLFNLDDWETKKGGKC